MGHSTVAAWTLTIAFAATALWFLINVLRTTDSPPNVIRRLGDVVHASTSAIMIAMIWPWGARIPVWPQVAVFGLGVCWFLGLLVVSRLRAEPRRRLLHDSAHLHHLVMAAALIWMIVTMPGVENNDSMPQMSGATAMPAAMTAMASPSHASSLLIGALAAYFLLAASPWLVSMTGAGRRKPDPVGEPSTTAESKRHRSFDAASHATMSIGMAALLLIML
jgi:hypothetical protein